MKINVAKSAGFCFGVKRAIEIAFGAIATAGKIYMLGDIVHNEEVSGEIKKAGIGKTKKLTGGKNKTFLVGSHGTTQEIINRARQLGYKIIDATCPMVKEIHKIVKEMENKGYKIIVIGDKKHDEVRGIVGQLNSRPLVIDAKGNLPLDKIKKIKKAAVVVQSTQNLGKVLKTVGILRSQISELKFFNTICRPTRLKQEEIKKMPKDNDLMIIIGSKASANTKRLYEISKSLNKNSYWIQSAGDLERLEFKGIKSVGVTAGASTPDKTIKDVVHYLISLPLSAPLKYQS